MHLPRPFKTDKANHRFYGTLASVLSAGVVWLLWGNIWLTAVAAFLGSYSVGYAREWFNKHHPVDGKPPLFDPEDLKHTYQPGLLLSLVLIFIGLVTLIFKL